MDRFSRIIITFIFITSIPFANASEPTLKEPAIGLFLGAQAIYGHVNYKTTSLINGFTATSVTQPNYGFRLITGWNFNQHFGSELGMVYFGHISFNGVGTPPGTQKIYHNLMYLIGKYRIALGKRFAFDIRGGGGYISRKGINIASVTALKADEILVPVYGIGASFNITPHWTAQATWMGAPPRSKYDLPITNMFGIGAIYRFGNVFA